MSVNSKDRDAPGIAEETGYWCTIGETRTDTMQIEFLVCIWSCVTLSLLGVFLGLLLMNLRHEEQFTAQANPTAANAEAILNGPMDPTMLERPRKPSTAGPLSGDVLRAYDTYQQEVAAAAGVEGCLVVEPVKQ